MSPSCYAKVSQIGQVTQQNTAGAETSAAASQELSSQAQHLRSLLACFTLQSPQPAPQPQQVPQLPASAAAAAQPKESKKNWTWNLEQPEVAAASTLAAPAGLNDREFGRY